MLLKIILLIVLIITIKVIYFTNTEFFEDVVLKNVKIKYKNTYYYEYDNDTYLKRLNMIFRPSHKHNIPDDISKLELNKTYEAQKLLDIYNSKIEEIKVAVQRPELKIKNTDVPIQMVSHKFIGWTINTIIFECVLYRSNKFEGKRIMFYVDNEGNYIDIKIIEEVSEDQIALYPIQALNPFEKDYGESGVIALTDGKKTEGVPIWQQPSMLTKNSGENIKDADARKPEIQKLLLNNSSLFKNMFF